MNSYTAIADMGETLIELLRTGLEGLVSREAVILFAPGEIEPSGAPRLCLFLYQVAENPHLKNREMERGSDERSKLPGLTLDLYYMLIPYTSANIPDRSERTLEEHRMLGRAMQVFHDNAVLRDPVLKGGLAGRGLAFRLMLNPVPIDEITKLWHSFQAKSYKPSVCYLVTPVEIESEREKRAARVMRVELESYARK